MNILVFSVLQAQSNIPPQATGMGDQNYFELLMKGGWIMVPLLLLSLLAVYFIVDRMVVFQKIGRKNESGLKYMTDLVYSGDIETAIRYGQGQKDVYSKVSEAGLKAIEGNDTEIQDAMQTEARVQIARLDNQMGYLGIISAIAPMLGFLGTIFGVIKIFYNISATNDLSISSISDGLYQKMICSGVGLLVGIIAYSAYYILNARIDKIVLGIDVSSNDMLKAIRTFKRGIK